MARLEFRGKLFSASEAVREILGSYGVPYECWGLRSAHGARDEDVLDIYRSEVDQLKAERGYRSVDLVALKPDTPNLDAILQKFDKEHHHVDDEVRFTVEGEGVFEIEAEPGEFLKFTAEPGDLIVIPANRRHLFYLTEMRRIRCIRLFESPAGWEAIYDKTTSR
jgi:1,2-dihydroxy-3-keto-5-methylthiopentene dioxygenase